MIQKLVYSVLFEIFCEMVTEPTASIRVELLSMPQQNIHIVMRDNLQLSLWA